MLNGKKITNLLIAMQRIQTLYLGVITVLFIILFFSSVAEISTNNQILLLDYKGLFSLGAWTVLVLTAVVPLISIISILLFKKRMLQIRLCIVNLILMIGYYPLLIIYIYSAVKNGYAYNLHLSVIYPIISAILCYLAIRAIGRDEALIKSLNRMR